MLSSHQIRWGDQIKEDDMRGACSTHREMKNAHKILVGKSYGKRLFVDLDVDGKILLKQDLKCRL
jgi:hypothetical protein